MSIGPSTRGHLRIYLGAAPGVGKTYAMLDEGRRRRGRGTDVVVGIVETHGRAKTIEQIGDLEIVAPVVREHLGTASAEFDLDAVLTRRPSVVLVDDLGHTNAPGSAHAKRWQDVTALLDAGIDVISTVNIDQLESLSDVAERITGRRQSETVPDGIVRGADQVELIDMAPEAVRRRMAHGNIFPAGQVDAALGNYFRVGNLNALRELALLWLADKVDDSLQEYMAAHDIDRSWETRERVVVAVTGAPSGEHLIRRAARVASRARGDLIGVHVSAGDGDERAANALLDEHQRLLTDLGGEYHEVIGSDVAAALVQFAKAEKATQLILGATQRSRWAEALGGSIIAPVLRQAGEIDVHVVSQPAAGRVPMVLPRAREGARVSPRRQLVGWLALAGGIPLLTFVLALFGETLNLTSVVLLYLLLVTVVAVIGGIRPSIVAAVVASLVVNWFFTPPIHTFTIAHGENLFALAIFLAVAALVSMVVSQATRRTTDVSRARAEAEALARVAGGVFGDDDPLRGMVSHLRSTFALDGVTVLVRDGDGWAIVEGSGSPLPTSPEDGESMVLSEGGVLVMAGPVLSADDRRVLQVFAAQLSAALERRRLRRQAAEAAVVAEADQLRTAILRAVSHDLRTPLASIKASVTSLLSDDIEWSDEDLHAFLGTIEEETDRLNELVGNLLDMSRIETDTLEVLMKPVGVEEVVARALASLSGSTARVDVDVSEQLARVVADPALLERAVANLVSNALGYSPQDAHVRIEAGEVGSRIDLRIIDRGPGVPLSQRDRMFEPFQRLGDSGNGASPVRPQPTGVGLGLAVARGFAEAMDAKLLLEDTPGGGLTAVLELRKAAA
jgi:two-component system sensor histidine kinase KdpD